MKKTASTKQTLVILLASASLLICVLFLLSYSNFKAKAYPQVVAPKATNSYKNFKSSKELQFSISIPKDFKDLEGSSVNLEKGSNKITVSRNGTNFENLNSYLYDFDKKRSKISITSQREGTIYGKNFISRVEEFKVGPIQEQKVYYILVNNWIYTLSTTSKELYSDLDQIAKSFKYTP